MVPPPSSSWNATFAFACPCPPASLDLTAITARWASGSCFTTSTVPVNVRPIAPIFTTISAVTVFGPVRSSTRPPSTHGTTRSRSRIVSKLSSIWRDVVKRWSSSTAMARSLWSAPMVTYSLGPDDGTLSVRTKRTGAAAKAGHNLLMHVTTWSGAIELGERTTVALDADGSSLRVQEGTGGMQALQDEDKENIRQTIDAEVLMGEAIEFR